MIAQLARRTFSSRSAIRAPPAPSSVPLSMAPGPARSSATTGRVAMMPRAAAENQQLPGTSSGVSTSAAPASKAESHEDLFQVGRISSHRDASTVSRLGETM
ncbi:uncharacterized protein PFL1_00927 [Pseudozyma flocculosa PF-1]|uniref:Uncharacterized protein n=1 Tax=Pseudozyma flocculosa TaxID=84751 RepID=A0A5C3FAI7_9BASI|nr:uncharacterized protein PFL1_00927 [Pseudozyma flocculosa PF-1]EPQ31594.1 hypothetical protein PFL1_00927 [Pseudozyma flocculosa PF-1]SPO40707.1 uncharacterized protein PSFLO_06189 [Pseudozyma flocculosa]